VVDRFAFEEEREEPTVCAAVNAESEDAAISLSMLDHAKVEGSERA
jgi:hypothetical protein